MELIQFRPCFPIKLIGVCLLAGSLCLSCADDSNNGSTNGSTPTPTPGASVGVTPSPSPSAGPTVTPGPSGNYRGLSIAEARGIAPFQLVVPPEGSTLGELEFAGAYAAVPPSSGGVDTVTLTYRVGSDSGAVLELRETTLSNEVAGGPEAAQTTVTVGDTQVTKTKTPDALVYSWHGQELSYMLSFYGQPSPSTVSESDLEQAIGELIAEDRAIYGG